MSMRAGPDQEGAPVSHVAAPAPADVSASRGWRLAVTTSAVLVLVLASVALVAGWRGADSVLRVIPDYSPQAPITAVCLALLAGCVLLSLWQTRTCTRTRHDGRRRRHVPDHARTEDPVRRIA